MTFSDLAEPTRVTRVLGVDIYIHWAVVLLVLPFWGLFDQVLSAVLAALTLLALVIVHEAGHAFFARRCGLEVLQLEVYPGIGYCIIEAPEHEAHDILIAWGGVIAKMFVLGAALGLVAVLVSMDIDAPEPVDAVFMVLITVNLVLVVVNLWPSEAVDGGTAWRILKRHKAGSSPSAVPPPSSQQADAKKVVNLAIRRAQRGDTKD